MADSQTPRNEAASQRSGFSETAGSCELEDLNEAYSAGSMVLAVTDAGACSAVSVTDAACSAVSVTDTAEPSPAPSTLPNLLRLLLSRLAVPAARASGSGAFFGFSTITFQTLKIDAKLWCGERKDVELGCSSRWRAGTGTICSPAPWLPHATACARVCAAAHSPCKLRGRENLAMPVCWTRAMHAAIRHPSDAPSKRITPCAVLSES